MGDIRLDKTKSFSECYGERRQDDPHYSVAFWQGEKLRTNDPRTGKPVTITVLLPFDANGALVPDDQRTGPFHVMGEENKPIVFHPLWNEHMRELVARKQARAAKLEQDVEEDEDPDSADDIVAEVNFPAWLRGDVNYEWTILQKAAKARFSRIFQSKKQMVEDLVIDFKLVPEDQVSRKLAAMLP